MRLLQGLAVVRYKPLLSNEATELRRSIVRGDKAAIFDALEWLLRPDSEAEKRLYLAKFLVPVQVPPEFLQDIEIEQLCRQCDQLMDEFKEVHREYERTRQLAEAGGSVHQDIEAMESERDVISRRVNRLKMQAELAPNSNEMFEACRQLRMQLERLNELSRTREDLATTLSKTDQKLSRLEQNIDFCRKKNESTKPEGSVQRLISTIALVMTQCSDALKLLEEEVNVLEYLNKEKLPTDIAEREETLRRLQLAADQKLSRSLDLTDLELQVPIANVIIRSTLFLRKVQNAKEEIDRLREQLNEKTADADDSLTLYRQQVSTFFINYLLFVLSNPRYLSGSQDTTAKA
ncbi:hypothetical protein TTRE_0000041401 [Trichuris trichiura]|uniref:IFT81 calponin homology domain-containing protein n=1 Tax=Trichuris trichiura TaxID=36087 RepID=A0A077Z0Q0_TRITR|nr:hypothetical protein TTRE_0000041401 [Trichuris trichiura]